MDRSRCGWEITEYCFGCLDMSFAPLQELIEGLRVQVKSAL